MDEADYLPLGVLEKFAYCQRQAYLAWRERMWVENRYTVEGNSIHRRVVSGVPESRAGLRVERSVRLLSTRLGLTGVADVIEWRGEQPYPVEYKRGRGRRRTCQMTQLCLQALCLEEMLGCAVPRGAIYHEGLRRREEIDLQPGLRAEVERLIASARVELQRPRPPRARLGPWCRGCSLRDLCMPAMTRDPRLSVRYVEARVR